MMFVHMARVNVRENQMWQTMKIFPTAYLLFAIAAIIVIGVGGGGMHNLIRN